MDTYIEDLDKRIKLAMEQEEYSIAMDLIDKRREHRERLIKRKMIYNTVPKDTPPKEYLFLTVNPHPVATLEEFRNALEKMVKKVWVNSWLYVLEQRGTTIEEAGKGFHAHIIIKKPTDKVPSHCIRELVTCFKNTCDVSNPHCFNTKWIDQPEFSRKLGYLLGRKEYTETDRKDLKQEMDRYWRDNASISNYYKCNIDIGQYAP